MKIAFIDDDQSFHEIVKFLLVDKPIKNHGQPFDVDFYYEVSQLPTHEEVAYDLILTDLQMRETQGAETIVAIQEKHQSPIIIMSGIGGDKRRATDGLRYLEMGVLDMLPKAEVNDPNFANNIMELYEQGPTFKHVKVTTTKTIDVVDSNGMNYETIKKSVSEG